MRKVIGIGETILDIIFRNNQPSAAIPGGSVFNCAISLARLGVSVCFISETGNDRVGSLIRQSMADNGMTTDYIEVYAANKSPISLAFLNDQSDAQYSFYKDYPQQRLNIGLPQVEADDIVILGSYYAVTPALRAKHLQLLEEARRKKAIVYYDLNYRMPHKSEAEKLMPNIIENMEYASIVRGSEDDFMCLFGLGDADRIYNDHIKSHCSQFIYTAGGRDMALRTAHLRKDYAVSPLTPVSTVGAGDNFNAGIIYGLLRQDIGLDDLAHLSEDQWDVLVGYGSRLATEVCQHYDNYISTEFASHFK